MIIDEIPLDLFQEFNEVQDKYLTHLRRMGVILNKSQKYYLKQIEMLRNTKMICTPEHADKILDNFRLINEIHCDLGECGIEMGKDVEEMGAILEQFFQTLKSVANEAQLSND